MAAFVPIARETAGYAVLGEVHGTEERQLVANGTYTVTAQQEFTVLGRPKLITVTIHTFNGAGTESTVPTIEYFDIASQTWVVLLTGAAITAAGPVDTLLTVGPTAVNTTNLSQNSALYTRMRINMTHGNANNHQYSISVAAV